MNPQPAVSSEIPWAAIAQAFGVMVGAGVALYQILRAIAPGASRLKHDLEVLQLAKAVGIDTSALESRLRNQVASIGRHGRVLYPRELVWTPQLLAGLGMAVALFIGFGAWTAYILRDGFTWWALLTGALAFGGVGPLMESIERYNAFVLSTKVLAEAPDAVKGELNELLVNAEHMMESCEKVIAAIDKQASSRSGRSTS